MMKKVKCYSTLLCQKEQLKYTVLFLCLKIKRKEVMTIQINYIREYYSKILNNEIIVSKKIRKLYKKLVNELDNPKEPWNFDIELATKPITFIESFCKHSKGKWMGKPIKLELFQKAMIQSIYGFINKDTLLRRVRQVFMICGRKNGKSVLTSGLALYDMVSEKGGQVVTAATKKDQAKIVFDESLNMVKQSPYLSKHIRKRKTDMYLEATFSTFTPLASDSNSLDGLNCSFCSCDEIHAWKTRDLYDVIMQSMSAREQPIMFVISTNGFVRESIFDRLYEYGNGVLNGDIEDDTFLPFFYELDTREEYLDDSCWIKANPAIDVIKNREELRANVEKSKHDSTFLPTLLTKDFNLVETVSGSWLTYDELNNEATFDLNDFKNSYGIGGVDLSSVGDLTCATLLLMKKNDNIKYVHQHYFIPKEVAEKKQKEDKVPYLDWYSKGLITLCEGNKVDYRDVTKWFLKLRDEYKIMPLWIGFDPWNSRYWVDDMKEYKFNVADVRQGFKTISPTMKEMELAFKAKEINYNNNPILKWCLSNTQVVMDAAGNIKFDKGKNKKQRIDGMASLFDSYFMLIDNFQQYKKMLR